MAADVLEDERADGLLRAWMSLSFRRGKKSGSFRKYSDTLLIFLLKGIRPQKWPESRATIPPAELNKMSEAELDRIAKRKEGDCTTTEAVT